MSSFANYTTASTVVFYFEIFCFHFMQAKLMDPQKCFCGPPVGNHCTIPFTSLFRKNKIQFSTNKIQLSTSEIQLSTNEIQFSTSKIQFGTNEIQFGVNEIQFSVNEIYILFLTSYSHILAQFQ